MVISGQTEICDRVIHIEIGFTRFRFSENILTVYSHIGISN